MSAPVFKHDKHPYVTESQYSPPEIKTSAKKAQARYNTKFTHKVESNFASYGAVIKSPDPKKLKFRGDKYSKRNAKSFQDAG